MVSVSTSAACLPVSTPERRQPAGRRPRLASSLLAALLLVCLAVPSVQAQSGLGLPRLTDGSSFDPMEQLRDLSPGTSLPGTALLEGAVDPDRYVVGPGDLFQVTIGGAQPLALTVPVSADGMLVLPESGGLEAAGRSLAAVRRSTLESLRQRYRNVDIQVSLIQPRQFYVHVAGAVPQPGRYPVLPVARVANALTYAFADTLRAPLSNAAFRPSLRTVRVERADTTLLVDVTRYLTTGDVAHNPYLQDGDVVTVPAYDPAQRSVFVDGEVPFRGAFAYRPGDTVLDLFALAAGPLERPASVTLRLTRQGPDGQPVSDTFALADLQSGATPAPAIEPLDHLYVVPPSRTRGTVTVDGFVAFPGTYPVELGESTIGDLLEQAGGVREDALGRAAYLMRPLTDQPPPAGVQSLPSLQERQTQQLILRADSAAFLQRMRLADFDIFSRTYFAQALREQGRVPIDLTSAEARATFVQQGDRLVVPRDTRTVTVFGQVARPGYYPYEPGLTADDYIARAGGTGPGARGTYLLDAGTQEVSTDGDTVVRSGDALFVDGVSSTDDVRVEQLRLQKSDQRLRRFALVVQTLTALATTYLLVRVR